MTMSTDERAFIEVPQKDWKIRGNRGSLDLLTEKTPAMPSIPPSAHPAGNHAPRPRENPAIPPPPSEPNNPAEIPVEVPAEVPVVLTVCVHARAAGLAAGPRAEEPNGFRARSMGDAARLAKAISRAYEPFAARLRKSRLRASAPPNAQAWPYQSVPLWKAALCSALCVLSGWMIAAYGSRRSPSNAQLARFSPCLWVDSEPESSTIHSLDIHPPDILLPFASSSGFGSGGTGLSGNNAPWPPLQAKASVLSWEYRKISYPPLPSASSTAVPAMDAAPYVLSPVLPRMVQTPGAVYFGASATHTAHPRPPRDPSATRWETTPVIGKGGPPRALAPRAIQPRTV